MMSRTLAVLAISLMMVTGAASAQEGHVWIAQIRANIAQKWKAHAREGQQPVVVLGIERDGRLARVAIEKSSGNVYYDQAAIQVIRDAAPFPPVPADLVGDVVTVHLTLAGQQRPRE